MHKGHPAEGGDGGSRRLPAVSDTRYRCAACGNLTRFDVTAFRRTRAFHHYSVAGELAVEEEEVIEERVEEVACRWCGPGTRVERLEADAGTAS
jgi:hypothetical protein